MQQALLTSAAAFVGSGAVCVYVFGEPIATSTVLSWGGPSGFLLGQIIGQSDVLKALVDLGLLLEGDYGGLVDMLFSGGLFGGLLFVKIFGGRTFNQGAQMLAGAMAAIAVLELAGISQKFSLFEKSNE